LGGGVAGGGEDPIGSAAGRCYRPGINPFLLTIVILLFVVGGGYYLGGPVVGGSCVGLVLLTSLIFYMMGLFRGRAS